MKFPPRVARRLSNCVLVAFVVAACSASEPDSSLTGASTTAPPTTVEPTVATTVATTTAPPTTAPIAWDELPPIEVPAGLVPEDYDGRFFLYATVIEDGNGPILCTPFIHDSDPPQCFGVPLAGWDWESVEHDQGGDSRWGEYALTGQWDGFTFAVTEPAFPVDWGKVTTQEPDPVDVPCPEPEGGWWSDVSDPERLGSEDYNDAIDVVQTRPELLTIDIVEPDEIRPAEVKFAFDDLNTGWVLGVLVIRLTETREGDEAAIREFWGGPLCLTTGEGPSTGDLNEIESQVIDLRDEIAPGSDFLSVYADDGAVHVGVWVATVEAQARLDEQFGPGVVRLGGRLWAID